MYTHISKCKNGKVKFKKEKGWGCGSGDRAPASQA
jgi:hypothetical protein